MYPNECTTTPMTKRSLATSIGALGLLGQETEGASGPLAFCLPKHIATKRPLECFCTERKIFWSGPVWLTLSGSTDSAPDDLAPASVGVFVLEQQKLFIKIGS